MKKLIPFLIIVFLVAACGNSYEENQRVSKKEKIRLDSIDEASLKIGVMPTLDCLPLYLAQEDSLFASLGVDVHLKPFTAQMDCDTALIGGSIEGCITDLFRVGRMQRKGIDLFLPIATNTYWQLISNRTARVKEVSQLSDKMIAMTRYSATDYLTDLAIDSAHPKYDVYRIQINDVNIRLDMLLNNEMDAMFLTEPQATKARLHHNPVLMDSRYRDLRFGVFAFRTKILKERRRKNQFRLFIKAYNMACDSLNKNGVKHYTMLLKKYYSCDEKTINALPNLHFSHASAPRAKDVRRADSKKY